MEVLLEAAARWPSVRLCHGELGGGFLTSPQWCHSLRRLLASIDHLSELVGVVLHELGHSDLHPR